MCIRDSPSKKAECAVTVVPSTAKAVTYDETNGVLTINKASETPYKAGETIDGVKLPQSAVSYTHLKTFLMKSLKKTAPERETAMKMKTLATISVAIFLLGATFIAAFVLLCAERLGDIRLKDM